LFTTIKLKAKDRGCKAFFGFYFGLSFLEDVQQPLPSAAIMVRHLLNTVRIMMTVKE
jgi:hypothetical protein